MQECSTDNAFLTSLMLANGGTFNVLADNLEQSVLDVLALRASSRHSVR